MDSRGEPGGGRVGDLGLAKAARRGRAPIGPGGSLSEAESGFQAGRLPCTEEGTAVWEGHHSSGSGCSQKAGMFFGLEHREDVWAGETDPGVAGEEVVPGATGKGE